jgi:hypothetical protein
MNADNEGWVEYGKLVLSELGRHNDLLLKISEKLDSIKLQQALYEKDINEVKVDLHDHDKDIKDLKKRVYKLEQGELIEQALGKYRKWMWAGAFGITASIVIPIADVIIKALT